MHAGNILCAIVAYLSVKSKGGKFIIRIEDVDTLRCPRRAAADIIELLGAFGIHSDEPIVYQSSRAEFYRTAVSKLSRAALGRRGAFARRRGAVLAKVQNFIARSGDGTGKDASSVVAVVRARRGYRI